MELRSLIFCVLALFPFGVCSQQYSCPRPICPPACQNPTFEFDPSVGCNVCKCECRKDFLGRPPCPQDCIVKFIFDEESGCERCICDSDASRNSISTNVVNSQYSEYNGIECEEGEVMKMSCSTCWCFGGTFHCTLTDCLTDIQRGKLVTHISNFSPESVGNLWRTQNPDVDQTCVEGTTMRVDCNTCVCSGGQFACTLIACLPDTNPGREPPAIIRNEICALPTETGPCRASIRRFAFVPDTNSCEVFVFGGCSGNANNFQTLEECLSVCGANNPSVGSCPALPPNTIGICADLCFNCQEKNQICCSTGCGRQCQTPIF